MKTSVAILILAMFWFAGFHGIVLAIVVVPAFITACNIFTSWVNQVKTPLVASPELIKLNEELRAIVARPGQMTQAQIGVHLRCRR